MTEELYEIQLSNMRERSARSAQKAVDYMDGDHRPWLERLLNTEGVGIKKWEERGFRPLWVNIVGRVIEKSALTYSSPPKRVVMKGESPDEAATDYYSSILEDAKFQTTMIDADQLTRLLKTTLILVQYVDGKYTFDVLSQHNSDAIYNKVTGEIEALLYASGVVGQGGGQLYYHWTKDEILELERVNDVLTPTKMAEENEYGTIPVSKFFDTKPPRNGLWAKPVYEQLVFLNDAVSMFNIEVKYNSRFGTIGTPITNMEVPDGTVIGIDAILELTSNDPDVTPFYEYRIPQANVEQFTKWAQDLTEETGLGWGVNLKLAGEGTADSGFKLMVEELPTLTLWKMRQPMAGDAEKDIYEIVRMIDNNLGENKLPSDSTLSIEFYSPELPVNKKEEWEIAQGEIALGVLTKRDYLKKKNPSWTTTQIEEYLELAANEKSGGLVLDLGLEGDGDS